MFRKDVDSYVRLYDFLSQIVDYGNTDLEKRSIFLRLFARLIRTETRHETIDLTATVTRRTSPSTVATSSTPTHHVLRERPMRKMLENQTIRTQVKNNSPQQVASSPVLEAGFTEAIIEARGSYADLTGQLLGAKDKRAAFLKELVGLLYVVLPELDASA